jgi:hypothetical protein
VDRGLSESSRVVVWVLMSKVIATQWRFLTLRTKERSLAESGSLPIHRLICLVLCSESRSLIQQLSRSGLANQ